ncbi:MAG: hypothetical protein QM750_12320 [Rubrivivax sp.]
MPHHPVEQGQPLAPKLACIGGSRRHAGGHQLLGALAERVPLRIQRQVDALQIVRIEVLAQQCQAELDRLADVLEQGLVHPAGQRQARLLGHHVAPSPHEREVAIHPARGHVDPAPRQLLRLDRSGRHGARHRVAYRLQQCWQLGLAAPPPLEHELEFRGAEVLLEGAHHRQAGQPIVDPGLLSEREGHPHHA